MLAAADVSRRLLRLFFECVTGKYVTAAWEVYRIISAAAAAADCSPLDWVCVSPGIGVPPAALWIAVQRVAYGSGLPSRTSAHPLYWSASSSCSAAGQRSLANVHVFSEHLAENIGVCRAGKAAASVPGEDPLQWLLFVSCEPL